MNKPHLILTEPRKTGLAGTTQEQRRKMTAAELIDLMGELHVSHPDYQPRPHPLLPTPNLAGRQPVISVHRAGFFADLKRAFLGIVT